MVCNNLIGNAEFGILRFCNVEREMSVLDKPRKPWVSGVLTVFTIGLGHFYAGEAKKGLQLYFFGQGLLFLFVLPLIYLYPKVIGLILSVLFGFLFLLYCIVDAVKFSKKKRISYQLKKYNRWYIYLACLVFASFIMQPLVGASIKMFLVQAYRIPAGSLEPTILAGDQVFAKTFFAVKAGINRGDIIIFPFPEDTSKDFIKRVVAMGGEIIEIINKEVFINGDLFQEPYVIHTDPNIIPKDSMPRDNFGPVTVPEDAVFVMGDNRDNSYDSRFWGFVKKSDVAGKAQSVYWSWDRENRKVRWHRIGKMINRQN